MKWRSWELPTPKQLGGGGGEEGHFLSISMGPQLLFILSPPPLRRPRNPLFFLSLSLYPPPPPPRPPKPLFLKSFNPQDLCRVGNSKLISGLNKQKMRGLLQSRIWKCKCEQWSWLTARKAEMKESCRCECLCFCSLPGTHRANSFFFFFWSLTLQFSLKLCLFSNNY